MVEVFVAGAVLALGMAGFVMAGLSSQSLQSEARIRAHAVNLARGVLETMQAVPFEDVFRTFNEDPLDDPAGPNTAIGAVFDHRALLESIPTSALLVPNPEGAAAIPYRSTVSFPVDAATGRELREDMVSARWPSLDLNGDGVIDDRSHATDYIVLPVRIALDWETAKGQRSIQLETLLTRR